MLVKVACVGFEAKKRFLLKAEARRATIIACCQRLSHVVAFWRHRVAFMICDAFASLGAIGSADAIRERRIKDSPAARRSARPLSPRPAVTGKGKPRGRPSPAALSASASIAPRPRRRFRVAGDEVDEEAVECAGPRRGRRAVARGAEAGRRARCGSRNGGCEGGERKGPRPHRAGADFVSSSDAQPRADADGAFRLRARPPRSRRSA
jgi:hypothetical protein